MTQLYILVRRTGSKRFIGAIPAKKGATKATLQVALKRLKTGYSGRIVTRSQLLTVIKRARPKARKTTTRRRTTKRK